MVVVLDRQANIMFKSLILKSSAVMVYRNWRTDVVQIDYKSYRFVENSIDTYNEQLFRK